jgi:hypothetical protein
VLAIGIGAFADGSYVPLDYPAKDAEDFVKVWMQQEGRLYSKVKPKLLTNEAATGAAIRRGMRQIVEDMRADDRNDPDQDTALVVFVSSHGELDTTYNNFSLIPHEGRSNDLENTAIDTLFWFKQRQAVRSPFYLVLDTCRAGSVSFEQANVDRYMRELFSATSPVLVFAASASDQKAREKRDGPERPLYAGVQGTRH